MITGVSLRYQPDAGSGRLSHVLLGLHVAYELIAPRPWGWRGNVFVGVSAGQIQLRPSQNGGSEPYISSGHFGARAGLGFGYQFGTLGVMMDTVLHVLAPNPYVGADFSLGLRVVI